MRFVLIVLVVLITAGCAAQVPREVRTGEIYTRHAAEEETRSVMFAFVRSWRRVGDDAVLIEFNRDRHFLFEVEARCRQEIPFARSIALVTSTRSRVDRFDRIRVGSEECRITSIREVDMQAVRADLAELDQRVEDGRLTIDAEVGEPGD